MESNVLSFGNSMLRLEQVCAPAGAKSSPTSEYILRLSIEVKGVAGIQKISVPMAKLDSLNLEQSVSGLLYASKAERTSVILYLREEAMRFLEEKPLGAYFPDTGWYHTKFGDHAFCAGSEILAGGVDHKGLSYQLSPAHSDLCFAAPADFDVNVHAPKFVASLLKYPEYRIPASSYTVFSHLRSVWPMVDLPFASTLFVVGKSGTGKSTLAKNFCQLYDTSRNGGGDNVSEESGIADYYDAFSSPSFIGDILPDVRDRVVLYDDICKSTSTEDRQTRLHNAVLLMRRVANESLVGKKLGCKNVTIPCRAGLVITAEILPQELSEITRCTLIHVTKERIGGTAEDRKLASGMLRAYLDWFAGNFDSELANLRQVKKNFPTNPHPEIERLWVSLVQQNWCFESFLRFLSTIPSCQSLVPRCKAEASQVYASLLKQELALIKKMEQKKRTIEEQIADGIKQEILPYLPYKGFICVQFYDLLEFLRTYMGNSSLSNRKLSTYLHDNDLISIDCSNRVSKKVNGTRYVFLNPYRLKLI